MKAAALLREQLVQMLRDIIWDEEFYKEFEAAVIEELAPTTCNINFESSDGEIVIHVGGGDVFKAFKLATVELVCVYIGPTLPQDIPDAKATLNHIDKFIARLQQVRTDLEITIDVASEKL